MIRGVVAIPNGDKRFVEMNKWRAAEYKIRFEAIGLMIGRKTDIATNSRGPHSSIRRETGVDALSRAFAYSPGVNREPGYDACGCGSR